jgi:hypothetical protein
MHTRLEGCWNGSCCVCGYEYADFVLFWWLNSVQEVMHVELIKVCCPDNQGGALSSRTRGTHSKNGVLGFSEFPMQ